MGSLISATYTMSWALYLEIPTKLDKSNVLHSFFQILNKLKISLIGKLTGFLKAPWGGIVALYHFNIYYILHWI